MAVRPVKGKSKGQGYHPLKRFHKAKKQWDALIEKYPGNMDIQMLHAVRIGLCKKIEDGSISFETASEAFNGLHETVYKRAIEERKQWLKDHRL